MLRYYVAFAVAIVSDLLDYTVVGSLPVIGDVIDAITVPILYTLIGKFSLFWCNRIHPVRRPDTDLYHSRGSCPSQGTEKEQEEAGRRTRTLPPL